LQTLIEATSNREMPSTPLGDKEVCDMSVDGLFPPRWAGDVTAPVILRSRIESIRLRMLGQPS
jgi:hypothetical protein